MARSRKDGKRHGGHRRSKQCRSLRGSVSGTNGCRLYRWSKTFTHRIERRLGDLDALAQLAEANLGDVVEAAE